MFDLLRFIDIFGVAARRAGYVATHLQGEISLYKKKGEKTAEGQALTNVDRIGNRWWHGEDPLGLPDDNQPMVVAGTRETVGRILHAITVA